MDITIVVARLLGLYLIVSGLFLVFRGKTVTHLLKDFYDHEAIVYLTGTILIFLSSAYLIGHNIWNGNWETIITIIAWVVFLKGVSYIFIPRALNSLSIQRYKSLFGVYGFMTIIVGVTLFFLG